MVALLYLAHCISLHSKAQHNRTNLTNSNCGQFGATFLFNECVLNPIVMTTTTTIKTIPIKYTQKSPIKEYQSCHNEGLASSSSESRAQAWSLSHRVATVIQQQQQTKNYTPSPPPAGAAAALELEKNPVLERA